ncbi:DUF2071 domain-containing protein [soil metagenome]
MTCPDGAAPIDPGPPERVRVPVMFQRWSCISFLHWGYPRHEIRPLVPPSLDLDLHEERAWISITPFLLEGLRAPFTPPLPWLSRSPETNVRTYVRGPDGRRGIFFMSLDIGRLPAVVFARLGYSLPYMWAHVDHRTHAQRIEYTGRRRLSRPGADYRIVVEAGAPYADEELTDLDHFLTARFFLFSVNRRLVLSVCAEHPRWPLSRARLVHLDESLLRGAHVPPPAGPPLVPFSPGVGVRIAAPRVAGRISSGDREAGRAGGP